MKKFIVFCLMAFVMCVNANGQTAHREMYGRKYTYFDKYGYKPLTEKTFHFEYDIDKYTKGVINTKIGCGFICGGLVVGTIVPLLSLNQYTPSSAEFYKSILTTSIICGACETIGLTFIIVGKCQKWKSATAITPNGIKIVF